MEFHEVTNIFPMMDGKPFEELKEDIKKNGLIEPIWTYQGKIIDGRNRFTACKAVGAEASFVEWDGKCGDLVNFVVSLNLRRRHLNESQRAMVAAAIANMIRTDTLKRGNEDPNKLRSESFPIGAVSQRQAAEMLNVSDRSIRKAITVKEKAIPEIKKAVESGKISVSRAEEISKQPTNAQIDIAKNILEKKFKCGVCGEKFLIEHWHCEGCDRHWPLGIKSCKECNKKNVEKKSSINPVSNAEDFAIIAISQLKRIGANDPYRVKALTMVLKYIKNELGEEKDDEGNE